MSEILMTKTRFDLEDRTNGFVKNDIEYLFRSFTYWNLELI